MSVGWTGIRHDVEPSRADSVPLAAKHRHPIAALQCELDERSISGESVKTRDERLVALKFVEQTRNPFLEVARIEILGVGGWTLDNVRKTDPAARKLGILLGAERVGAERSPHALAQLRHGERRPEPAR